MSKSTHLLDVQHLKKYFKTPGGMLHAVDDVSFTIDAGKTLGVVGESGCGKSTLGRTILGLAPATEGEILFHGKSIVGLSGREQKQLYRDMQLVFQDPYSSLNPRFCVFDLIAEPLRVYKACKSREELHQRVLMLMDTVGLAHRLAYAYPHELDGGRRQRIGIARALAMNPQFIVCDEPVSALDVSIQAQILNLLQDLQEQNGLAYMFITHDLSVVRYISDDIMVMYVGTVVEKSSAEELFEHPMHPYTQGLLSAIPLPVIDQPAAQVILQGEITSPVNPKPGCRFADRCPHATEACTKVQPELKEVSPNHFVACHNLGTF
ncbi:MAG: ATP-binding cassette domain-containing protein [Oscillospiraceae bacterium]|nr:ATP-binding cassette domain-containing protein [Oscillospiraceae bacterium]